jgi:hypothetical protein
VFTAQTLYGAQPQAPSYGVATVTQSMGLDADKSGWGALVDPHNPLLWFGGFLLVTFGAAAVSGSARLGRAKASATIGDSK